MQKLDIPNGFTIQQLTPLRVLHRRPLLTRPRQIFSVKGYVNKGKNKFVFLSKRKHWIFRIVLPDNLKMVILDLVTQAGTYIKELVHGEFGRTSPSISSIIDREIDIVELDVNGIDLDWPAEIDNKSNDNEHTIEWWILNKQFCWGKKLFLYAFLLHKRIGFTFYFLFDFYSYYYFDW